MFYLCLCLSAHFFSKSSGSSSSSLGDVMSSGEPMSCWGWGFMRWGWGYRNLPEKNGISGWFYFNTVLRKAKDQTCSFLWAWDSGPWMTWMAFSHLKNLIILYSDFPSFSSLFTGKQKQKVVSVSTGWKNHHLTFWSSHWRDIFLPPLLFISTLILQNYTHCDVLWLCCALLFTYDLICRLNMWLPMMSCLPWGLWCWLVHRWKDMRCVVLKDVEVYHHQTCHFSFRKTLLSKIHLESFYRWISEFITK